MASCHQGEKDVNDRTRVLLMWSTNVDDPVYQLWTAQIQQELKEQGIEPDVTVFYGRQGEMADSVMEQDFIREIHALKSDGQCPDLILGYGDYVYGLLHSVPETVHGSIPADSIPAVCFGLNLASRIDEQGQPIEDNWPERPNLVPISAPLDIKANLDLANLILNLTVNERPPQPPRGSKKTRQQVNESTRQQVNESSSQQVNESSSQQAEGDSCQTWTHLGRRHRFCSLLDPVEYWIDAWRFDWIEGELSKLDSTRYFNNLFNQTEEDSLAAFAERGGIVYSCRSLLSPNFNSNPDIKSQFHNKWAFYPQMSPNYFMQVKHDKSSRRCTEGPGFSPYFTMIAEDFLVNDSCIGGCFAPFDEQARDAVCAAKRLLAGETSMQIGRLSHVNRAQVNWDVLRGKGLSLNQIPEDIQLYNVGFKDVHPQLYVFLSWTFLVVFILALLVAYFFSRDAIRKQRLNAVLFRDQALKYIQKQLILDQTLKSTGALSWQDEGDEYTLLTRLKANAFYTDKLASFLKTQQDGRYFMQLQAAVDGQTQHWYDLRMNVTHDRHGVVKRQGVFVNIDRQKEQESRNMEIHHLLLNAMAREGFINSMYHEVRTPLNAVVGFAQVLAMPGVENTPEEIQAYSDAIESNAAVLKKMINDLLLVTLMNNSNVAAQCQKLTMNSQMNPDLWGEAQSTLKRRKNVLKWEHDISGITVHADPKMLAVVMENLVLNASKFSEEGSTITIGWALQSKADERNVEIWVRDEGKGIDAQYREMIFDRFFKIDSFQPGCGLGLFICKTYVEMMGGHISFDSQPNRGTTFRVTLNR